MTQDHEMNDNWPEGSLEQFIWERCEADNERVREIMAKIRASERRLSLEKLTNILWVNSPQPVNKFLPQIIIDAYNAGELWEDTK